MKKNFFSECTEYNRLYVKQFFFTKISFKRLKLTLKILLRFSFFKYNFVMLRAIFYIRKFSLEFNALSLYCKKISRQWKDTEILKKLFI